MEIRPEDSSDCNSDKQGTIHSFVISARPIATIGGTSAQNDEYIFGTYSFPLSAANTVIAPHAKIMRQVSTAKSNFFLFLITLSPSFCSKKIP